MADVTESFIYYFGATLLMMNSWLVFLSFLKLEKEGFFKSSESRGGLSLLAFFVAYCNGEELRQAVQSLALCLIL
jgi:hypothetical protein